MKLKIENGLSDFMTTVIHRNASSENLYVRSKNGYGKWASQLFNNNNKNKDDNIKRPSRLFDHSDPWVRFF